MNNRLSFRPNLVDCVLEERIAPAIANLATVILTTSGYTLIEGFPGANTSGAGSLGASSTGSSSASSVSGAAIPTTLFITGQNGISSLRPGNITGVPSLGASATGSGGVSISIQVGSGADSADGSTNTVSNNVVGRATVADPTANPTITVIGGSATSDSSSPILPPGQSYRETSAQPTGPPTTIPQSSMNGTGMNGTGMNGTGSTGNTGSMGGNQFAPNPQMGAPTLGPSSMNRGGMVNPIPGSLVPVTPMLPGNN
jgi:hypothetical protein